jgi:uncharacterized protein
MKIFTAVFILILTARSSFNQNNKPVVKDNSKPFVLGVIEEIQSSAAVGTLLQSSPSPGF